MTFQVAGEAEMKAGGPHFITAWEIPATMPFSHAALLIDNHHKTT